MAGKTGYTEELSNEDFDPVGTPNRIFAHFDALTGESRASAANFPTTNNWRNRVIMAEDTKLRYVWDGTAWKMISRPATFRSSTQDVDLATEVTILWQNEYFAEIPGLSYSNGVFTVTGSKRLRIRAKVGAKFANTYINLDLRKGTTKVRRHQGATSTVAYTSHILDETVDFVNGDTFDVRAVTGASCGLVSSDAGISGITNLFVEQIG